MFRPKEIIYGFALNANPPKNKYLIVIYSDDKLNIIASFTTSKARSGIPYEAVKQGSNYNAHGELSSYVFEASQIIGINPNDGSGFSFPRRTTVVFDYGIVEGSLAKLKNQFLDPEVVCVLDDKEYENLVYAMYKSPMTKKRHKAILDKVLQNICK